MLKKIIYTAIALIFTLAANSQEMNNTLYFLRYSPQANSLNPAINPEAKVWGGIPGLTSIGLNYNNNSFSLSDLLVNTKTGDKPVKIDINNLYSSMAQNTTINMNNEIVLMSVGIKAKNQYFTLDIKHKNNISFGFDKSIIGFFKEGTVGYLGKSVEFGDTQMNALAYNEIAIGYSREIGKDKKLVIGGKLKAIMGVASVDMRDSQLSLSLASDGMDATVRSKQDVRIGGPIRTKIGVDPNDFKVGDLEIDDNAGPSAFMGTDNLGFGIDLGATYKVMDKVTLYASILDLGYIKWSNGTNVLMDADYLWKGINYTETIKDDNIDAMDQLSDDLEENFKLQKEDKSFTQMLPTKIYIGGQYEVKEWFTAGILNRNQFYYGRLYSSLTLSGNVKAGRRLSASVSYSVVNNSYTNIGFGFTSQLGPLQLYMVTDNVLASNLTNAQLVNFRMGLNIRVGLPKKKIKKHMEPKINVL